MEKVKELRVTVRMFLTKPNTRYPERTPVPMRTMFGYIGKESAKGVYMVLRGKPEPSSHCLHCGRTLTHPVSLLYGIGPICGGHYHMNPFETEEELQAHYDEIRERLSEITWEGWLPKAHIDWEETGDEIEIFGKEETNEEQDNSETKIYPELSEEQEDWVEKARKNFLERPNKAKPTEIWIDRKGIVKLVFEEQNGKRTCYKIGINNETPFETGLPFPPKYSKIHDIEYIELEAEKNPERPAVEVVKAPEIDQELVSSLADELNSLFN